MNLLPQDSQSQKLSMLQNYFSKIILKLRTPQKKHFYNQNITLTNFTSKYFGYIRSKRVYFGIILDIAAIILVISTGFSPAQRLLKPLVSPLQSLKPIEESKSTYEVFGFAPFWTINKLQNVDFKTLTTLAYFGMEIDSDGQIIKDDPGYQTFHSKKATELFKRAHQNGTRVVLTITQMENQKIKDLMDNPEAQNLAIESAVQEVKDRGIDGINIDFEYSGNPGQEYRDKFTQFVATLNQKMHQEVPSSKVSVSVYASAVKDPKIYDIKAIANNSDLIFMMAYDFAVAKSDNAIPTAPLYGHKAGKYWYDISTAVDDFLASMPAEKLVLGVPYYGYNYLVYEPSVKAETRPSYTWRGRPATQTYSIIQDGINENELSGTSQHHIGWDDLGKVSYKAYYVEDTQTWRMVFFEDEKSLGLKYDFAKNKRLAGVGMWALGFDDGKQELWTLLREKFGQKQTADAEIINKPIN